MDLSVLHTLDHQLNSPIGNGQVSVDDCITRTKVQHTAAYQSNRVSFPAVSFALNGNLTASDDVAPYQT